MSPSSLGLFCYELFFHVGRCVGGEDEIGQAPLVADDFPAPASGVPKDPWKRKLHFLDLMVEMLFGIVARELCSFSYSTFGNTWC